MAKLGSKSAANKKTQENEGTLDNLHFLKFEMIIINTSHTSEKVIRIIDFRYA